MRTDAARPGNDGDVTGEFETLTLPHLGALYGFAVSRLRDAHAAEDLVQETCLKAYRAFDQFARGTDYKAWLFRILVNTIVDSRRKVARAVPFVSLDAPEAVAAEPAVEWSPEVDPERQFAASSLARDVQAAMGALSPDWHAVVHLSFVEGFSYKEIAGVLGCPIGTVMSRLYRARQVLRERLAPHLGEGDVVPRPARGTVQSLDRLRARLHRSRAGNGCRP